MQISRPRASALVFFLLAGVYVAVRLWNLGTFCLDSDEVWSLTCARASWSGLFRSAAYDIVHPPLFYILLKVWIWLGATNLLWLRLLPALLSFVALVPFYFLCRSVALGPWQMNLALALLTLNADQVFHSQYLRMYTLLFLLSLCSYCAFVNYVTSESTARRAVMVMSGVNLLLVYSHYYGWAVVGCEMICLLIADRKKLAGFITSSTAVLICFLPWVAYAANFAIKRGGLTENLGWIRRPTPRDLFTYFANLTTPQQSQYVSAAFLVLCGILLYVGLRKLPRDWSARDRWRMPLLLTGALLPPAAAFMVSQVFPESVWGIRHLVVMIVPFYLLIAIALGYLRFHRMRAVAVALVGLWVMINTARVVHPRPRVNYEVLAEQMISREPSAKHVDLLIADRFLAFPLTYQLEQHAPGRWGVKTIDTLDVTSRGHFWVAYHQERWKGDPPKYVLSQRGYRVGRGVWVGDDWHRIIAFPVEESAPSSELVAR